MRFGKIKLDLYGLIFHMLKRVFFIYKCIL